MSSYLDLSFNYFQSLNGPESEVFLLVWLETAQYAHCALLRGKMYFNLSLWIPEKKP